MKWIPGFEDLYAVTLKGEVISFHGEQPISLVPTEIQGGYLKVALHHNGQRTDHLIHRLVLETFMSECPPGCEARHLDGNPKNNLLNNLAWGTPLQNSADKRSHGTIVCGENHGRVKVTTEQVREIKERYANGETQESIAADYPITRRMVGLIVNGKKWTHL